MSNCLFCYKELPPDKVDFHPACANRFFGSRHAPLLPYRRDQIDDLAWQVIRSQTTLTGVQPKLSLDLNTASRPQRLTIVGLWGRFILKPQSDRFPHLPELEDLTMHLAKVTKIPVVPHSLIRFDDGELCYITRRIDRLADGSKLPMEDACQLTERLTEFKYKGSYEQIAKMIRKYSSQPQLDIVNFWEVVIFSWITGNADMHLKNFSLFNPGAGYVLTPAYDLLSTALVMPDDTEELALTLNAKKRKLQRHDFVSAMLASGLNDKVIANIERKFCDALPLYFDIIDASFLPSDMCQAFKLLILSRIKRLFPP